jgi:sugar lactone lactonase YvrE
MVATDGASLQVADGLAFPNGMLIMPDGLTLIVAESYAKRLTAFDVNADGGLSNQRVWADLGDGVPDSSCADAENAVWYADVPNKRCVRIREGGTVLAQNDLHHGCFACALGGTDGTTPFMLAQEWNHPANMFKGFGRRADDPGRGGRGGLAVRRFCFSRRRQAGPARAFSNRYWIHVASAS